MMTIGFLMDALQQDLKAKERVFMHQCLVREVIKMRMEDRGKAWDFVEAFQEKHPESTLKDDVIDQWRKGNRGLAGDWR